VLLVQSHLFVAGLDMGAAAGYYESIWQGLVMTARLAGMQLGRVLKPALSTDWLGNILGRCK